MRDLKKIKQIRHCNIIQVQICRNGCFWNKRKRFSMKRKRFSMKRKLFPTGNSASDAMEQLPHAIDAQKLKNQKPFKSFGNTGSKSWSKPKAAHHKRSNTMFEYTGYSQKTEHLEQPLHTNRSQINTSMFVTWLKPSRGKQSTAPAK